MGRLFLVILHHPVDNKHGQVVTTAPVAPDVHDIARSCATFGVERYYVATPLERHRAFVRRMVEHWTVGSGAAYNPDRKSAMELIKVVEGLEEAVSDVEARTGRRPYVVATAAREGLSNLSFEGLRERMERGEEPCLLVLGTGFGLSEEALRGCQGCLEPIEGSGPYNHLAVRSAAAIILDRLRSLR